MGRNGNRPYPSSSDEPCASTDGLTRCKEYGCGQTLRNLRTGVAFTNMSNSSTFSVNFQIIQRSGSWVYGHFYFVIDGQICGDPEDYAALNIVFGWVESFLESKVTLDNETLSQLTNRELVAKLYDAYMVISISELDVEPIVTGDSPHDISYLGMSAFDGWMILLVELSSCQRMVWASLSDKKIYGVRLPLFKVQQELAAALKRYKSEIPQF